MVSPVKCAAALAAAVVLCPVPAAAQSTGETQEALFALEAKSHQQWLEGNVAALDELMADEFHLVVMNGAVEAKAHVVGSPYSGKGALRIQSLQVEPETFVLRGDVAIVISVLHLDGTARGQRLAPRMRVLSVFTRDDGPAGWKLTARSITPILAPPR